MVKELNSDALFLPFMQIPTGHHHVADSLMEDLHNFNKEISSGKVDILSYSYGKMERVVSSTYLTSIKLFPHIYNRIYDHLAYKNATKRIRHIHYEMLFTYFFKRLLKGNEPAILFCTHCLPSNLAGVLKQKRQLNAITVNVYTDYFVNRVWGIEGIDYHFVPSVLVKKFLRSLGVEEEKIFITGIPVHAVFHERTRLSTKNKNHAVLVTGGSLGVGAMEELLPDPASDNQLHYYILCGKNEALYSRLLREKNPSVTPIPFINRKEEMNRLYDKVDAVVTKPGGVTISECLMKRKPIFICHALPGQEIVNAKQLKQLGLINTLRTRESIEDQITGFLNDSARKKAYEDKVEEYHKNLENKSMIELLEEILCFSKIKEH
ncbi:glycosyltransferase [Virgibacillus sp. C22-A2]|uniref:Glycosyltransferase n=1 Tax=Virgibacillus tibetensis TaxID=3042313 RepID=A0ABU6KKJ1_9BACI|nr:glycosyltransferase [Virgibacillus sp. C22-A2]